MLQTNFGKEGALTFQEFKDGMMEEYERFKEFYRLSNPRVYEKLPFNCAKKYVKKQGRKYTEKFWFMCDWDGYWTCIMTYSFDYIHEFRMYFEYNSTDDDPRWAIGHTDMQMGAMCICDMWTTFSATLNAFRIFNRSVAENQTHYYDDAHTEAFANGDCPMPREEKDMSFTQCLKTLIEARKHPEPEWRGQRIAVSIGGAGEPADYMVQF